MSETQDTKQQENGDGGSIIERNIQNPTLRMRINAFMQKEKINTDEIMYYVYKYDNPLSGNSKTMIDKTTIEPDEDTIGREHGGGRYLICLTVGNGGEDGKMRSYEIKLNKRYDILADEMKRQKSAAALVPASPAAVFDPSAMMATTMTMMKTMIEIFAPIMRPVQPVAPALPDLSGIMVQNFQTVNELMRGQAVEMAKLMREVQRGALAGDVDDDIDEEDREAEQSQGILEMIAPLLSEYIPKLLGDGPESKIVQTAVRSAPQFKQIVKDKNATAELVNYLDQTQGKQKTDAILQKLKVQRPGSGKR